MKVLLINGSPHEHGCTDVALTEVENKLHAHGVETERFWLGTAPMAGCIACMNCAKTGLCVFRDSVNKLLARAEEFDGMVVGSPVYYAGPAGQLTAFLDRLFYASRGKWAGKPAAAVVSCRRGGASAAFDRLNKYFTICRMPVVSSQYWNQIHGNTPDEAKQDLEGLQTMRTLGEQMAHLLRALEIAKREGLGEPEREKTVRTNFIR